MKMGIRLGDLYLEMQLMFLLLQNRDLLVVIAIVLLDHAQIERDFIARLVRNKNDAIAISDLASHTRHADFFFPSARELPAVFLILVNLHAPQTHE